MNEIKYAKAPVSEVILGLTFNESFFKKENFNLKLIAELSSEFPIIENHPPIFNEVFSDGKIIRELNTEKTGEILYRLSTLNRDWLLQIQNNKIYINWMRQDNEDVGNYPGYSEIFRRFNNFLTNISTKIGLDKNEIFYLEMTYHDRLDYEKENITNASDLNNFINLPIPDFRLIGIENEITGVNNRYTFPLNALNGHLSISISNAFSSLDPEKKVFSIQFSIKGKLINKDIQEWFNSANEIQNNLFIKTFKEVKLNQWL